MGPPRTLLRQPLPCTWARVLPSRLGCLWLECSHDMHNGQAAWAATLTALWAGGRATNVGQLASCVETMAVLTGGLIRDQTFSNVCTFWHKGHLSSFLDSRFVRRLAHTSSASFIVFTSVLAPVALLSPSPSGPVPPRMHLAHSGVWGKLLRAMRPPHTGLGQCLLFPAIAWQVLSLLLALSASWTARPNA